MTIRNIFKPDAYTLLRNCFVSSFNMLPLPSKVGSRNTPF
jgi:hypothetical protein